MIDSSQEQAPKAEENTHTGSIVDKIREKIHDALENMDTDFPLSGGEEHPVHHEPKPPHEGPEEEKPHHKTSFFEDLDTDFPLSGGEVSH